MFKRIREKLANKETAVRGIKRLREIFLYSDSEPNEVLIAICHLVALPASLIIEYDRPHYEFILVALFSGGFQLWAVAWNGTLKMRLLAVQLATIIAICTIINLSASGLMCGSRLGWVVIGFFAVWNTIRVFMEKLTTENG